MRKFILFISIIFISFSSKTQSLYFPPTTGSTWDTISPTTLGWCDDRIDSLYQYLESANSKKHMTTTSKALSHVHSFIRRQSNAEVNTPTLNIIRI